MKGWVVLFCTMLGESAPWYLPAVFLSVFLWAFAVQIAPALSSRPWLRRLYHAAPPVLIGGMVLHRAQALLTLDQQHNEVALFLGSSSPVVERLQVLLTGYGGIEGALFALVVFALAAPSLPSLRGVHESTRDFVRHRMMMHNGVWAALLMLLLLPSEAHLAMANPPMQPTVSPMAWSMFGSILLFTLLVMMAGEMMTASAHIAVNNETRLLFNRAMMKTVVALVIAWALLFQSEVFSPSWWSRPASDAPLHAALLVAVYTTLVVGFHAPASLNDSRFHHHPRQVRSLTVSLALTAVILLALSARYAHRVDIYGEGAVALLTGWRISASLMLLAGLMMLLPSLGYDAAHRPEAWWFRVGMLFVLAVGIMIDASLWLAVPGLMFAASLHVLLPWASESKHPSVKRFIWVMGGAWLVGFVSVLNLNSLELGLFVSVGVLGLCAAFSWWAERQRMLDGT